ncbi:hypothetical protein E3E22_05425 [Thermococcus sp. MV5]|nr:hypothetical protein [Thermococcus sp. MV5]
MGKPTSLGYTLAEDYAGYNSPFLAQHGIFFPVEVEFDGNKRRVLFDTASHADIFFFKPRPHGRVGHSCFMNSSAFSGILILTYDESSPKNSAPFTTKIPF